MLILRLSALSVAVCLLSACGNDSNAPAAAVAVHSSLYANGVTLPHTVIKGNLTNGTYPTRSMEVRQGGYGSDIGADPQNINRFYGLTDRGPNADYSGAEGDGKMFLTPDYQPKIGHFELQADGSIRLLKTIGLKRPDGKPLTGLPNPNYGATNEIAYGLDGKALLTDPSKPFDATSNPTQTDPYGFDSEGLAVMADGSFWISDEYGPHLIHFDASGKEIERINPFAADPRNKAGRSLPAELGKRRANRGMEGLTVTPDGKTLVGIMQSTLNNPSSKANKTTLTRLVTIDLATGKVQQYLYKQEQNDNSNCAIVALSATSFLVLERDGEFPLDKTSAFKRVYRISLTGATDLEALTDTAVLKQDAALGLLINGKTLEEVVKADGNWNTLTAHGLKPVSKTLVVDMVASKAYPHDKMEGLWLRVAGSKGQLGIINDDDFGVGITGTVLEQKYLEGSKKTEDRTRLYLLDGLDLSPAR